MHGDLFDVLPTLEAETFDACVTDPPYGIGFMGREWDTFKPSVMKDTNRFQQVDRLAKAANPNIRGRKQSPALSPSQIDYDRSLTGLRGFQEWTERWASEVYRVLKPGAHLIVCGAPRSHHRMMCGLEDAGFEIRDCLAWLFGQGFPKSKNLGGGWGTALKPGHEPIVLVRKPFKGSITENHQRYGVGGLNIDACRIDAEPWHREPGKNPAAWTGSTYAQDEWTKTHMGIGKNRDGSCLGRWPANVLLDEEATMMLDEQAPFTGAAGAKDNRGRQHGFADGRTSLRDDNWGEPRDERCGASRFFYVAKPSREERDLGCEHLAARSSFDTVSRDHASAGANNPRALSAPENGGGHRVEERRNFHPT